MAKLKTEAVSDVCNLSHRLLIFGFYFFTLALVPDLRRVRGVIVSNIFGRNNGCLKFMTQW